MERAEVITRVVDLMHDIFDDDDIQYADSLTAEDVEEWDSLSNVRFIVSIEQAFGIRFSVGEIEGFKNVGELVDKIVERTG